MDMGLDQPATDQPPGRIHPRCIAWKVSPDRPDPAALDRDIDRSPAIREARLPEDEIPAHAQASFR
jgi:hypothetical protein